MNKSVIFILAVIIAAIGINYALQSTQEKVNELAQLKNEVEKLKAQTQMTRNYIDIANLQAIYGYYVDKSQWNDASDLFTEDATLEIAGRGLFDGQDRIREYLSGRGEMKYGRLYNHMQLQPVIHIDENGVDAKARWRSFMQVGHLGEEARWGEATYENEYRKEDGTWKIKKLHSFVTFYVDFDKGWNKGAIELPGEQLESDGGMTVKYGAFPDVFLPPYHYENPVTGE